MPEVALADLWLLILLSAVAVFVVSSVIHMATPMHKKDMTELPNQDAVLEAMRSAGVKPGGYFFPYAGSMKVMGEPAFIEKQNQEPVGFATILPNGPVKMGASLATWFVYSAVIALFAGYIGTLCLPAGEDTMRVFRITGTVAVLAFAVPNAENSIWRGVSWGVTARFMVDGLLYGLTTAGVFASMWPGGAS
ncbi:MAG: hypothetical protein AAGI22_27225 [Planctomycetota bacterium]